MFKICYFHVKREQFGERLELKKTNIQAQQLAILKVHNYHYTESQHLPQV